MKESFLKQLAKPRPDPGGGAAAAYGASLGLALLEKIAHLEYGRRHNVTDIAHSWPQLLAEITELNTDFSRLIESDVEAYRRLVVTRSSGSKNLLSDAIDHAINCPVEIMTKIRQALALAYRLGGLCKQPLVADLLVAVEFFGASLRGAHHIAVANVSLIENTTKRAIVQTRLSKQLDAGLKVAEKASREMLKRLSS